MIRLLLLVAIIFLGILVGPSLMGQDSYVLIAINGWTIETSLVVMTMVIIVFYALLQLAEWGLVNAIVMWGRTRHWFGWRKERIAEKKTIAGVLELAAGHFSQAEQLSVSHVKHSKQPLLNYFTAINAAQTQGKIEQRNQYLAQALAYDEKNTALLAMKLKFMIQDKDFNGAKEWLEKQPKSVIQHSDLLGLNLIVAQHFSQWTQMLELNELMLKHRLISSVEHEATTRTVYVTSLKESAVDGYDVMISHYKAVPRKYRNHIDIFCQYAKLSIHFDHLAQIEKELFKRLSKELSTGLLSVLRQCNTKHAKAWSERLVSMDKYHQDEMFLDVLVDLFMVDREWKQAKDWLLKVIQITPNAVRYETLARTQQELGESSGALDSFNKALGYRLAQ